MRLLSITKGLSLLIILFLLLFYNANAQEGTEVSCQDLPERVRLINANSQLAVFQDNEKLLIFKTNQVLKGFYPSLSPIRLINLDEYTRFKTWRVAVSPGIKYALAIEEETGNLWACQLRVGYCRPLFRNTTSTMYKLHLRRILGFSSESKLLVWLEVFSSDSKGFNRGPQSGIWLMDLRGVGLSAFKLISRNSKNLDLNLNRLVACYLSEDENLMTCLLREGDELRLRILALNQRGLLRSKRVLNLILEKTFKGKLLAYGYDLNDISLFLEERAGDRVTYKVVALRLSGTRLKTSSHELELPGNLKLPQKVSYKGVMRRIRVERGLNEYLLYLPGRLCFLRFSN